MMYIETWSDFLVLFLLSPTVAVQIPTVSFSSSHQNTSALQEFDLLLRGWETDDLRITFACFIKIVSLKIRLIMNCSLLSLPKDLLIQSGPTWDGGKLQPPVHSTRTRAWSGAVHAAGTHWCSAGWWGGWVGCSSFLCSRAQRLHLWTRNHRQ